MPKKLPKVAALCHRRNDPPGRVRRPALYLSPKSFLAFEIGDEDPTEKLPKAATLCHSRSDPRWRVVRPASDQRQKSFLALEIGVGLNHAHYRAHRHGSPSSRRRSIGKNLEKMGSWGLAVVILSGTTGAALRVHDAWIQNGSGC
jgi:hypothetical protein